MAWDRDDVAFEFRDDGLSGDNVVTARVTTPYGVVHLMADVEETEHGLRLSGLHIHSENGRNTVGPTSCAGSRGGSSRRRATMKSSLKERLERLGPILDVARVGSGSPLVLSLSPSRAKVQVLTVPATLALAKRGLTLLKAKRVIEEMLDKGRAVAQVPRVEDAAVLARELDEAGCCASQMDLAEIDIRAVRERLGLTQEQFAWRYGLDVSAIRNWETGRRKPDPAALGYLRVIDHLPDQVSRLLEKPLG